MRAFEKNIWIDGARGRVLAEVINVSGNVAFTIHGLSDDGPLPSTEVLEIQDREIAERVVASVNYCRRFPLEKLLRYLGEESVLPIDHIKR